MLSQTWPSGWGIMSGASPRAASARGRDASITMSAALEQRLKGGAARTRS